MIWRGRHENWHLACSGSSVWLAGWTLIMSSIEETWESAWYAMSSICCFALRLTSVWISVLHCGRSTCFTLRQMRKDGGRVRQGERKQFKWMKIVRYFVLTWTHHTRLNWNLINKHNLLHQTRVAVYSVLLSAMYSMPNCMLTTRMYPSVRHQTGEFSC